MSKTHDRVAGQIFDNKKRIEHALKVNSEIRKECLKALKQAKKDIEAMLRGAA